MIHVHYHSKLCWVMKLWNLINSLVLSWIRIDTKSKVLVSTDVFNFRLRVHLFRMIMKLSKNAYDSNSIEKYFIHPKGKSYCCSLALIALRCFETMIWNLWTVFYFIFINLCSGLPFTIRSRGSKAVPSTEPTFFVSCSVSLSRKLWCCYPNRCATDCTLPTDLKKLCIILVQT